MRDFYIILFMLIVIQDGGRERGNVGGTVQQQRETCGL